MTDYQLEQSQRLKSRVLQSYDAKNQGRTYHLSSSSFGNGIQHSLKPPPGATSNRLDTQQMLPNFRKNYQIYELQDQISKLKSNLNYKNKQIFYFSTQTVSIKQQYTQKIILLQNTVSQQKKQLTELRYLGLKDKRTQNQKNQKFIEELKRKHLVQIKQIKKFNEATIERMNLQHKKDIQNVEQKLETLLRIQKREKIGLEELSVQKINYYETTIQQFKQTIEKAYKQKNQSAEQLRAYEKALESIKSELKKYSIKMQQRQKQLQIQKQRLKIENTSQSEKIKYFEEKLKTLTSHREISLSKHTEQLDEYRRQSQKLKQLINKKDSDIAKILQVENKTSSNQNKTFDLVKACKHEGLIKQLERNILIKQKQNQELRQQLVEWGKYIGFEKSMVEKSSGLLNASSSALITQVNFSKSLRRRAADIL